MGRTYLSKIPTISSNPHTIMLLLIVGEFGYPEVYESRSTPETQILNQCQSISWQWKHRILHPPTTSQRIYQNTLLPHPGL